MEEIKKYWLEIIAFFVIIVISIYLVYYFNNLFNELYINSKTTECHEIYGYFGSYVGGILGTILTAITLVIIYFTYTSQRKESKIQSQLIAQQQFESTFFNLLNLNIDLKNSLRLKQQDNILNYKVYEGFSIEEFDGIDIIEKIEVFSFLREQFKELYSYKGTEPGTVQRKSLNELYKDLHEKNEREKIIYLYQELFFKKYQNVISSYCRNIYQILKYIRESEKQETLGKKRTAYLKYTNILQSQLNNDEQFLIFYDFIAFNDEYKEEFSTVNLCKHYNFLENIGIHNLMNINHKEFYDFVIKGSDRKIEKK